MKRYFYAFVGSPATYGTPNPKTGRCSAHGSLFCFDTKAERDEFCDVFNHNFGSYPKPTNKKEAKSLYFAGMTSQLYDELILGLQSGMLVSI